MIRIHKPERGLYLIRRASDYSGCPCEDAFKAEFLRVDSRNAARPKDIPFYKNKDEQWWFGAGTNHRIVDGCITRDMEWCEEWAIRCDDLLNLVAIIGRLIIDPSSTFYPSFPTITIYDSYVE